MIEIDGVGSYLIREVTRQPNCYACEPPRLNARITILRSVPRQVDSLGRVTREAGKEIVCENLLAAIQPETAPMSAPTANAPGIYPETRIHGYVAFSEQTRTIQPGDEFTWSNAVYRILDAFWTEVDINETYGVIHLRCQRKAGESA